MSRFEGRAVVVTGGAGAIGSAAARLFAAEGAFVTVLDRDRPRAESIAGALGERVLAVEADVGSPEDVAHAIGAGVARFGRLDAVFNNAGISGEPAPVHELSVERFDEVVRINLRGAFLVLREAARVMVNQATGGSIVNMSSSMAGWDVLAGGAAYAATKHGVVGLTRTAALDLAPYGIRVNAVCPGVVETALGIPDLADGPAGRDRFEARIPLRRIGQPEDVAAVAAFLVSDEARHVTGTTLLVDGGQTLQSWANSPSSESYPLSGARAATTEGGAR